MLMLMNNSLHIKWPLRLNPDCWCRLPINHRLLSLFGSEQSRAINFSQFISSYTSFHFLATEARPLFCHAPLLSTWSSRCGSCELPTWPRKNRGDCHQPIRVAILWPSANERRGHVTTGSVRCPDGGGGCLQGLKVWDSPLDPGCATPG